MLAPGAAGAAKVSSLRAMFNGGSEWRKHETKWSVRGRKIIYADAIKMRFPIVANATQQLCNIVAGCSRDVGLRAADRSQQSVARESLAALQAIAFGSIIADSRKDGGLLCDVIKPRPSKAPSSQMNSNDARMRSTVSPSAANGSSSRS